MGMGVLDRYRRIAGAFALVGTMFYAALIPLHVVSQATATLLGETIVGARAAPCHEASGTTDRATNDPARKAPVTPQKHCPFCQGFAAFQFAIAPAHTIGIVRVAIRAPAPHLTSEGLAGVSLRAPQSRGPPAIQA
ncbi:hypothetical protein [Methyloceanibacter sp.]|uniref:hypothetical protein n=1 Tax=Methyloceanibacter sp. TaxID=1965321 RepID=UPI003D6CECA3